ILPNPCDAVRKTIPRGFNDILPRGFNAPGKRLPRKQKRRKDNSTDNRKGDLSDLPDAVKNLLNEIASFNNRITNIKQEVDKTRIFLKPERHTGKITLKQDVGNASNQVRDAGKNITNGQDTVDERVIFFPAESITQRAGKVALEEQ